jgi:hypothetical protein
MEQIFAISLRNLIWNFPQHTVVKTAHLYVFSECECHLLEYLAWFFTSKVLRSPNLRILVRFLKIQTDSARSGLKADIQLLKGKTVSKFETYKKRYCIFFSFRFFSWPCHFLFVPFRFVYVYVGPEIFRWEYFNSGIGFKSRHFQLGSGPEPLLNWRKHSFHVWEFESLRKFRCKNMQKIPFEECQVQSQHVLALNRKFRP